MKKKLSSGILWTTYFEDSSGCGIYDREERNKTIIEYYLKNPQNCENYNIYNFTDDTKIEPEPEIIKEEIREVVKRIKKYQSPRPDK